MPKKKPPPPPPLPEPQLGRSLLRTTAMLAGLIACLSIVIALGRYALEQLRDSDRYSLSFSSIECAPLPSMERGEFLEQVQYHGALPDRLRLLDEDLARRLADAFALHPWVERVERVEVTAKSVHAVLHYRRPALAVHQGGQVRVVDGHGVLLPKNASAKGLPVYLGNAPPPAGPAGTHWGDRGVEDAARNSDPK